jgi:hypothetical protein
MNVRFILFFVLITFFVSCNKREVVPAPELKVELESHFIGKINGANVEITRNVNGYRGSADKDLIVNAGDIDSAIYHSIFKSNNSSIAIDVSHGSLLFDSNKSSSPANDAFESFFVSKLNQQLSFSIDGLSGISVKYTDGNGYVWTSNENNSYYNEKASYFEMDTEGDASGEYAKFKLKFDTYVYRTYGVTQEDNSVLYFTDSMLVTDAIYTGWYKV